MKLRCIPVYHMSRCVNIRSGTLIDTASNVCVCVVCVCVCVHVCVCVSTGSDFCGPIPFLHTW